LPGLHLFTLLQFGLVLWLYEGFLKEVRRAYLLRILWLSFLTFVVLNATWVDGISQMNPHARAVQCITLLVVIISYFLHLLRKMEVDRLERDPLFWVSSGLLIYFSGSFFVFLVSNYLLGKDNEMLLAIFSIVSILNILANLSYAIALWVRPKQ